MFSFENTCHMWESDNCVTFDDRSLALHVSIPRTSDNDTRQSQHSVLHHAHQARPRPRPGDFYRLRNSPTPCQHAQCYPDRLSEIFVSQMIYCKSSEQTMQIFSPGLVPGHCTDDWVLPSPKIKTVKRDAVCSEPSFLDTRANYLN